MIKNTESVDIKEREGAYEMLTSFSGDEMKSWWKGIGRKLSQLVQDSKAAYLWKD